MRQRMFTSSTMELTEPAGAGNRSPNNFRHLILTHLDKSSLSIWKMCSPVPWKHRMNQTECLNIFSGRKSIITLVFRDDNVWNAYYIIALSEEKLGAFFSFLLWCWRCKPLKVLMRGSAQVTGSLWRLRSSFWVSFTLGPGASSLMGRFCGMCFCTYEGAGWKLLLIFLIVLWS